MNTKQAQVQAQCKAVAFLASAIAQTHSDYVEICAHKSSEKILEQVGERTARFMETLGNMLNEMGGEADGDEWLEPIFEEAQRLWPQRDAHG